MSTSATKYPKLFKKNSNGSINQWEIWVMRNEIFTRYGQVDGQLQVTTDLIKEGKNLGKANATTAKEQAIAEANSKHEKQLKKGYVDSLEKAQLGQVDGIIEGGISPMLAHPYDKHGEKMKFPGILSSPKLDGIRLIATIKDGKCTLWSRTRKMVYSLPHIVKDLEDRFPLGEHVLDGEIYAHQFRDNFEKIVSIYRQETPDPDHKLAEYWIFDYYSDKLGPEVAYSTRFNELISYLPITSGTSLNIVTQITLQDPADVYQMHEWYVKDGYEGGMLRSPDSPYEFKRSYFLQKVKSFQDEEFEIIGIDEGKGKLQGHVGAFVCRTKDGKEFNAKMAGDTKKLKKYFENHDLWKGQKLTIKYQNKTREGIPRFPIALRLRDEI